MSQPKTTKNGVARRRNVATPFNPPGQTAQTNLEKRARRRRRKMALRAAETSPHRSTHRATRHKQILKKEPTDDDEKWRCAPPKRRHTVQAPSEPNKPPTIEHKGRNGPACVASSRGGRETRAGVLLYAEQVDRPAAARSSTMPHSVRGRRQRSRDPDWRWRLRRRRRRRRARSRRAG